MNNNSQLSPIPKGCSQNLRDYIKATRDSEQDKHNKEKKEKVLLKAQNLREEIIQKVQDAISSFYKEDGFLLRTQMHEVTICGRLAMYLQKEFKKYKEYRIDLEYYRLTVAKEDVSNIKKERIRCDILLHSRSYYESCVDNLLAIEVKLRKYVNQIKKDKDRLKSFVSSQSDLIPDGAIHNTLVGLFLLIKNEECTGTIFTSQESTGKEHIFFKKKQ